MLRYLNICHTDAQIDKNLISIKIAIFPRFFFFISRVVSALILHYDADAQKGISKREALLLE